jgi:hypothetical protein
MSVSEIKFINDNHNMLISKIDLTNNKLNTIINEISNDLKDCIFQFTDTINNKLKLIESKFNKQTEELTILKKELENKSFDDKNYMNVSITMNLSKQIKERDLKIKELEQRIKFIENKKQTEVVPEVTLDVIPEVVSNVIPEVVLNVIPEVIPDVIPDVAPEVIKSKTKKTSVKIKQSESIVDIEPSSDKITKKTKKSKNEEVKAIVEEINTIVEEIKPIVEEVKTIEEVNPIVEEINPIVEIKPIEEKKSKKKDSNKVKKEKIVKQDNIEISSSDNKEDVIEVKYPDIIADINDIDILEVNNKNYFIDKKNNIYQITDDQDIGIFLGVYDKIDNKIIYMK